MAVKIFTLRRAHPEDAAGINSAHAGSIQQICFVDYTAEQIEAWSGRNIRNSQWIDIIARDYVWVIEDKNKILGYGHLALMSETEAEIMGLYLLPEAKGRGYGKKIFQELLLMAQNQNILHLSLLSTLSAQGFYLAQGFSPSGGLESIEMRGVAVPCIPMQYKF